MSTFDYTSVASIASAQITTYGTACLHRRPASTYSAITGAVTGSATDTAVKAMVSPYKRGEINGTSIQANDRQALISAADLSTEPKPDDEFFTSSTADDAQRFRVVGVEAIKPGDTAVAWVLQVRR